MTVQPLNIWMSTYEDVFFKEFTISDQPLLFRNWVHQNTQGLMEVVYGSKPTVKDVAFPPVTLPSPGTPVTAAQYIASAWFTYINSIVWSVPPPIPPFSAITGVVWDLGLVSAAQASLQAALVVEFTKTPKAGPTIAKSISAGMANAFYAATMSIGVLVTGSSMASPPVPLIVPSKIL